MSKTLLPLVVLIAVLFSACSPKVVSQDEKALRGFWKIKKIDMGKSINEIRQQSNKDRQALLRAVEYYMRLGSYYRLHGNGTYTMRAMQERSYGTWYIDPEKQLLVMKDSKKNKEDVSIYTFTKKRRIELSQPMGGDTLTIYLKKRIIYSEKYPVF